MHSNYAAVETTDTDALRNRIKQEALERERLQQQPSVNLQGESAIKETAQFPDSETPCFEIKQLTIVVPGHFLPEAHRYRSSDQLIKRHFRFAQAYLEQFTGRCIGREGINYMVRGVTALILDQGYITTRVTIPAQDMSDGTFELTLIPGIIHALRFEDAQMGGTWENAFPTSAGQLLYLRDLEQGLEQMKRVPSQEVEMKLLPAAKAGESDVVISVKHGKSWRLNGTLDDSGAKGTGKLQAGLQLALDNPFNVNDTFTLGINSDADRNSPMRGTQGGSLGYAIPFGYWTLNLSANESVYHQRIAGAVSSFVSSGASQNLEFKVGYLIQRDQFSKNTLQFRTAKRSSRVFVDDVEVAVQRHNTSLAEIAWIHKHNIGEAQLDSTLAYRWGAPWFDAQEEAADIPANSPRYRYGLETLDIALNVPFHIKTQPFSYSATFRAQNSHTALYASEWFAIGNRWTVRGFDGESSLGAEKGYFLRNEISLPLPRSSNTIYMGLDFGQVYGDNVANLLGNKLAGAVLGMRGRAGQNVNYELFAGIPLNQPHNYPSADPAAGFNLTYQM